MGTLKPCELRVNLKGISIQAERENLKEWYEKTLKYFTENDFVLLDEQRIAGNCGRQFHIKNLHSADKSFVFNFYTTGRITIDCKAYKKHFFEVYVPHLEKCLGLKFKIVEPGNSNWVKLKKTIHQLEEDSKPDNGKVDKRTLKWVGDNCNKNERKVTPKYEDAKHRSVVEVLDDAIQPCDDYELERTNLLSAAKTSYKNGTKKSDDEAFSTPSNSETSSIASKNEESVNELALSPYTRVVQDSRTEFKGNIFKAQLGMFESIQRLTDEVQYLNTEILHLREEHRKVKSQITRGRENVSNNDYKGKILIEIDRKDEVKKNSFTYEEFHDLRGEVQVLQIENENLNKINTHLIESIVYLANEINELRNEVDGHLSSDSSGFGT